MPVHLHNHQEVGKLADASLLVDIDDVVHGEHPCADPLHFLDELRKLNLNRDDV